MTMTEADDDCPPCLELLEGQLSIEEKQAHEVSQLSVAPVTAVKPVGKQLGSKCTLSRGLFDTPKQSKSAEAELPMIKPKRPQQRGRPDIPDALRLQADEATLRVEKHKAKLVETLKPDESTMKTLMQDPVTLALFDNKDVMAAVAEAGRDPSTFQKHSKDPRVMRMYRFMAGQAAQRMQSLAGQGQ